MTEQPLTHMSLALPDTIVSSADIARIERELSVLHESYSQQRLRGQNITLPVSRSLEAIGEKNSYNLHTTEDRQMLAVELRAVKAKAPVVHVSFASEPSAAAITRLVQWFRAEIHAYTLLVVGVAPSIVGGCIVRTPNSVYDMSIGEALERGRPLLGEYIKKVAER